MKRPARVALLCTSCLVFVLAFVFPLSVVAKSVRSVVVDDGSVTGINTAVGFSTILEFQSKPISAVLGDQDSFKLEYVGNSITIKPLVPHAKSNLFVFTEYERFNCQIVTVPVPQVDYIVRIRSKPKAASIQDAGATAPDPQVIHSHLLTRAIHRSASYHGFTLTVLSLSREDDAANPRAVTLIEFSLSSSKIPYSFQAGSVGVKQAGRFLDIESLYLDGLQLVPGAPDVHGKLALLSQDFKAHLPVTLVFAVPGTKPSQNPHRIEVPTTSGSARTATRPNGTAKERGK